MTVGITNSWDYFRVSGASANIAWPAGKGTRVEGGAGSPPGAALTKPGTLVLLRSITGNNTIPTGAEIRDGSGSNVLFDVLFSADQRQYRWKGLELWNGLSAFRAGGASGFFIVEFRVIRQVGG